MKIGPSYGSGGPQVNGTQPDGKQAPAAGSSASSPSTVRLSDLSARLTGADATVSAGAPFDVRKVEEIKAAITDGKFKVNTSVVADKLINNVREMLGGQARR